MRSAFVLGAGLGARLLPLTERRPKPLIPLFNKPLATFAMDLLIAGGCERFIVNTHHCASRWAGVFGGDGFESEYAGRPLHFRHEPVLLDTGGGLKNIEDLGGGEDLLVFNGDVLADLPLAGVYETHCGSGNAATLVLRSGGGPLQVRFNAGTGLVEDIRDTIGSSRAPACVFTGIYVIGPEVFAWIEPGTPVSIVPILVEMLRAGRKIGGVLVDSGLWMDLGTPAAYLDAHRVLAGRQLSFPLHWPVCAVAQDAVVSPDVLLEGNVAIGARTKVEAGVRLSACVLWENARVAPHSKLQNCIVRDNGRAAGSFQDTIF